MLPLVGLDVHARSVKACAFVQKRKRTVGEVVRLRALRDKPRGHPRCPSTPNASTESGVTGFHLYRELRSMGVDCVVGAVSRCTSPPQTAAARPTGATRAVPRRAARAGRGHQGARARCRMPARARPGFDAGPRRRAATTRSAPSKSCRSSAQRRVSSTTRGLRRPEAQPLDQGFLGVGQADRPRGQRRHGDAGPLLRARAQTDAPRPRSGESQGAGPAARWKPTCDALNASRASTPSPRSRSPARSTASRGSPPPGLRGMVGLVPSSTQQRSRNSTAG